MLKYILKASKKLVNIIIMVFQVKSIKEDNFGFENTTTLIYLLVGMIGEWRNSSK